MAGELRFGIFDVVQDALLAFEQLETHIGGAQISRDADQIVGFGSVAVDDVTASGTAYGRDVDGQPRHRSGRIASRQVDVQLLASQADTLVELLQRLDREFRRHAERQQQLFGQGVHRQDVARADGDGLVAQMFEREVGEVEVDPFHQQVGRDERRLAARSGDHGRVVAYAPQGRPVAGGECAGEFVDKAEFPQFGDLRPFVLFHASDRILHKSSENFAVSQLRSPRSVRRSRSAVIPREDRTSVQRPCRRFSEGKGRRRTVRRGRDIIIFKELCRFRENRLFLPL